MPQEPKASSGPGKFPFPPIPQKRMNSASRNK